MRKMAGPWLGKSSGKEEKLVNVDLFWYWMVRTWELLEFIWVGGDIWVRSRMQGFEVAHF